MEVRETAEEFFTHKQRLASQQKKIDGPKLIKVREEIRKLQDEETALANQAAAASGQEEEASRQRAHWNRMLDERELSVPSTQGLEAFGVGEQRPSTLVNRGCSLAAGMGT